MTEGTRAVRGRLAAVSVRAALAAGAWVGFALGLVFGAFAGAGLVWFAGAIVDWQRDLAFTLGVTRRLLPFGDQVGLLRELEARWWFVIPAVALAVAAVSATVGALLGGIFAAAYRASPRHALVIVELPEVAAAAIPRGPDVAGPPGPAGAAGAAGMPEATGATGMPEATAPTGAVRSEPGQVTAPAPAGRSPAAGGIGARSAGSGPAAGDPRASGTGLSPGER